jgi:hypothetical protein
MISLYHQTAIEIVKSFQTSAISNNPFVEKLFEEYPRNISQLITLSLDIPVLELKNLTLQTAQEFICILWQAQLPAANTIQDRALLGLLHVGPPSNLILVQAGLPFHIANYVIGHELGHFLADVYRVEKRWLAAMPQFEEEIKRAFTWEYLDAWLDLSGFVKNLPHRPDTITARGSLTKDETTQREVLADLIARELIAPWSVVLNLYKPEYTVKELTLLMHERLGLPQKIGYTYAQELHRYNTPQLDFFDRIFGSFLKEEGSN